MIDHKYQRAYTQDACPKLRYGDTCVKDVVTSGFPREKQKINQKYIPNARVHTGIRLED